MKNILLTIEYDGTNFCGWQRQPNQRSVQGEMEKGLSIVCNQPVQINGTSRTDAGVHAYGQRASFKGDFGIPVDRIKIAANNLLPGDVQIVDVKEIPLDFHARFDAVGKKYIYIIKNTADLDIFDRNYSYQVAKPLNLEAMKKAAENIVGTHDFKCFQAAGGKEMETTVRTIYGLKLYEEKILSKHHNAVSKTITLEIIGNGFLYNMVRIIAGTLVDVGVGKIDKSHIQEIIKSKNRQMAGHTAPPQGLYLAEVYYDLQDMQRNI